MPTEMGDFHHPLILGDNRGFEEKYEKALQYVREGLPPMEACQSAFEMFQERTFRTWILWATEDVEAGFTEEDSNLIKLMVGLAKEDNELHKNLAGRAIRLAQDGNANMLQFLLKTRYGYTEKTKSEVDVTVDETPIKFEIVDMQPNEEE